MISKRTLCISFRRDDCLNTNPDAVAAHEMGHVLSLMHHNCTSNTITSAYTGEYYNSGILLPTGLDMANVKYFYGLKIPNYDASLKKLIWQRFPNSANVSVMASSSFSPMTGLLFPGTFFCSILPTIFPMPMSSARTAPKTTEGVIRTIRVPPISTFMIFKRRSFTAFPSRRMLSMIWAADGGNRRSGMEAAF